MKYSDFCIVLISGGSEVASLAVADAVIAAGFELVVISLTQNSIFTKFKHLSFFKDLSGDISDTSLLGQNLLSELIAISNKTDKKIAIFPSEDGGVRLLNEISDKVCNYANFSKAESLTMGGIDKSEVLSELEKKGLLSKQVDGCVIEKLEDAEEAFHIYGDDVVFKPALKPFDMDLSDMGGSGVKVITKKHSTETKDAILQRLNLAWNLSEKWIAQPRLQVGPGLERSVCLARGNSVRACQVVEQLKYPAIGGTAIWVKTETDQSLVDMATKIANALDLRGICEISFLPDKNGIYRFVELNPRPWLQVGLVEASGFNIISDSTYALLDSEFPVQEFSITQKSWVQLERLALAFLSGNIPRANIIQVCKALISKNTIYAGYSSKFSSLKLKILYKNIKKIF